LTDKYKLDCPLSKPQGTETYCYSKDEVRAMVDHCMKDPALVWLGRIVTALSHTGLRISELAGLRWSDIDLESNCLRIADERSSSRRQRAGNARTTKGRRSRVVPIHPRLKELLIQLERSADGRVFRDARGAPLNTDRVRREFIRHVIEPLKEDFPTPPGEIGFEDGRLHSFRHFFCSQCFLGGASEGEIREWLGHADSKMVEHYRHLRSEDSQRKMKQIEFLDHKAESDRPSDQHSC